MQAVLKRWFGKFPDLGDVVRRFPVAVLAMAIFTLIIIFREAFPNDQQMARLLAGLVIGAYLCVSAVLASESRGKSPSSFLQLAIVLAAAGLGWLSEILRLNLFMAVGAAVLLLGNAVIWRQKRDDLHVWDFTHKLWTGAIFAVAGSVIFTLGLLAITAALKSLFGINIKNLLEDLILPIGLGFLAPLYWMATLPPTDEDYSELYDNPSFVSKAVTFLGTWLLSPLTLIYALILLAYGVKIIISGELPKGEIAALTTPFLIVGTLTWIVLDPPFARAKALAKLFRKLWWPASIPAALLLAVAVFVRIREYGYTPERFALTLLIVWAIGLALWFIFAPKERRDIRFIPGAAAGLLALGAVSAGWLSHVNQSQRFVDNLYASGISAPDGMIAQPPVITNMDAARAAKGAFLYLINNEGRTKVAEILEGRGVEFDAKIAKRKDMLTALGLEEVQIRTRFNQNNNNTSYRRNAQPISVADFDTLHGVFNIYERFDNLDLLSSGSLTATVETGVVTFNIGEDTLIFDPKTWIDAQDLPLGDVDIDTPLIILKQTETQTFAVLVDSFTRWNINTGEADSTNRFNMDFYVLTRGIE